MALFSIGTSLLLLIWIGMAMPCSSFSILPQSKRYEHRCCLPATTEYPRILTSLGMGKGLNKARNKQGDLAKKLALAKKQNRKGGDSEDGKGKKSQKLTDEEIKEKNDRLRFEELLNSKGSTVLNDYESDGYLNKQQEEEEIVASRAGVDRLFEGDPAPEEPFETLVSAATQNPLGRKGAEKLVPWLSKGSSLDDYLIIVSDPREKSEELRETIRSLKGDLPLKLLQKLIIVNADSPPENRRFLKKAGLENVDLYSDENKEWMKAYTALGDTRWSMTLFVISDRRVVRLARELDTYAASRVIQNAIKSLYSS